MREKVVAETSRKVDSQKVQTYQITCTNRGFLTTGKNKTKCDGILFNICSRPRVILILPSINLHYTHNDLCGRDGTLTMLLDLAIKKRASMTMTKK
jgi:hypothetical protein